MWEVMGAAAMEVWEMGKNEEEDPQGYPLQDITARTAGRAPGRPGQTPDDPAQRPVRPGQ
jgi:hypothetical protein